MLSYDDYKKTSFHHGWDLSCWIVLLMRDFLTMMKYNLAWRTRFEGRLYGVFYIKQQKARFKVTNCKIVSPLHLVLLMLCTCEQEQIESVWSCKWTLSKDGKKNPKPHSLQFQQLGSLTCGTLHYPNTHQMHITYKAIVALQFRQTYRQWQNTCNSVEAGRTYNCIFW
jgi:hypothetical protein